MTPETKALLLEIAAFLPVERQSMSQASRKWKCDELVARIAERIAAEDKEFLDFLTGASRIHSGPATSIPATPASEMNDAQLVSAIARLRSDQQWRREHPFAGVCGEDDALGPQTDALPRLKDLQAEQRRRRVRGPSNFEVMEVTGVESDISHGVYDTIDEARGCVEYDGLTRYEIWRGDTIVEEGT